VRILGKRSLAASLKFLVDLTFYLALLLGTLVVVVMVVAQFLNPKNVRTEIPVSFDLDRGAYSISSAELGIKDAEIVAVKGHLKVPGARFGRAFEHIAFIAAALVMTLLILKLLGGILGTLKQGSPFVQANVKRIRSIGFLIIGLEILTGAMVAWWAFDLTRHLQTSGLQFRTAFDASGLTIFTGVILILLAEVFRIGADMKGDLEAARTIQFQLVPAPRFSQNRVQLHCHMRPANTVGGDYYDIIPLAEDTVALVVADVSGKGMPAALLMTMLQGSLRTLISAGFRGEVLIERMNQYLVRNTPENKMVTLFFAELNTATGDLTYTNAGHNPPLLLRAGARLQTLDSNSLVLGLLSDARFTSDDIKLEAGDRLIIYTDGLVEAFNKRDEEFGEARLRELAVTKAGRPAVSFQEDLYKAVLAFWGSRQPVDDMTVMILDFSRA
jgi:hypothetical protein